LTDQRPDKYENQNPGQKSATLRERIQYREEF